MKKTILLAVLSFLPFLFGCAVGGVTPVFSQPLPLCADAASIDCIIPTQHLVLDEVKDNADELPEVGLAMSGGGSKAAPFAMGVLKRFVDTVDNHDAWIFKLDYLSSVSGSGYSAFFLYQKAYLLATTNTPSDPEFPGLSRFFVDARNMNINSGPPYFVDMRSLDLKGRHDVISLAEAQGGRACEQLTVQNYAGHPANETTSLQKGLYYAIYQGWVECYQDLLMTHRAVDSGSHTDRGTLAVTFAGLFGESLATAPMHYVVNQVWDWRKRLSPSQFAYLYGIERTYAYLPEPGTQLPTGTRDPQFKVLSSCFQFSQLAEIYKMDPAQTAATVGGYLPKWVLQATGASGNIGLDLSRKPYNLDTDVFEITFDQFGSGRYHFVKGSPALIGLTVPLAVLSSSAFFDTAQRSLKYPRAAVNALLQAANVRWGFDIANYNTSRASRIKHSLLIWPIYFRDDPVTTEFGPTIHLSDGGQSGDNLGMISLLRRSVRNIIVANGENDWHNEDGGVGFMSLSSLCAVNYYLVQHGYTMVFEADPRTPGTGGPYDFDLSKKCSWDDKHLAISISPDDMKAASPLDDQGTITPFNWKRRVWIGRVQALEQGETEKLTNDHKPPLPADVSPKQLDGIRVYYLTAALDKDAWVRVARKWYNRDHPMGRAGAPFRCNGYYEDPTDGLRYPCGLIEYMHDTLTGTHGTTASQIAMTDDAEIKAEDSRKWVFPQNSTAWTTYSNSVYLFRAYRDLGWAYADALAAQAPDLMKVLARANNAKPEGYAAFYAKEAAGASLNVGKADSAECQAAKNPPLDPGEVERN